MAQYLSQKTVHQFVADISDQHQAITSTVITVSGAQLVALAEACMQISLDHQVDVLDWQEVSSRIAEMARIKEALIACANEEIASVTEFELAGDAQTNQQLLELTCKSLAESASFMVTAADMLQAFEPTMLPQVRTDAEIAQELMSQVVQAAVALLESLLNTKDTPEMFRRAMQQDLTSLQRWSQR